MLKFKLDRYMNTKMQKATKSAQTIENVNKLDFILSLHPEHFIDHGVELFNTAIKESSVPQSVQLAISISPFFTYHYLRQRGNYVMGLTAVVN